MFDDEFFVVVEDGSLMIEVGYKKQVDCLVVDVCVECVIEEFYVDFF